MILYRKEPYPLQMKNIILLDDYSTGGVVYVSKVTYEQAVVLFDRQEGDVNNLMRFFNQDGDVAWKSVPGLKELMGAFKDSAPEPLNILAPFLRMLGKNKGLDLTDAPIEKAYGILHQISNMIDFNAITLVPASVRTPISIPNILLNSYQQSWDNICTSLEEQVAMSYIPQSPIGPYTQPLLPLDSIFNPTSAPAVPAPASVNVSEPENVETNDEEDVEDDNYDVTDLFASFKPVSLDGPADDKKSSSTSPASAESSSNVITDSEEVKQAEALEASKILDEFDV